MVNSIYGETAAYVGNLVRGAIFDYEAFEMLLMPCELSRCRATCCYDGVYLGHDEERVVRGLAEELRKRDYGLDLPDEVVVSAREGRAMKTAVRDAREEELAEDFPPHFEKTRCVFLDGQGRCGLQRMAMEDGLGPWDLKPLTCWIHPIVLLPPDAARSESLITLEKAGRDTQAAEGYPGYGSCTHCGREDGEGMPAREVLAEEIAALGALGGRRFY